MAGVAISKKYGVAKEAMAIGLGVGDKRGDITTERVQQISLPFENRAQRTASRTA